MKKKILILGYGNSLRQDDGVGIEVVRRLQEKITSPNCTFMTAFQPQPEMIFQIIETDVLLIIDASASIRPGAINRTQLSSTDPNETYTSSSHFLTPQRMLLLCEQLYEYAPYTLLYTIGGYNFGYGKGFSAIVSLRLNRLVDKILTEIQDIMEVADYV